MQPQTVSKQALCGTQYQLELGMYPFGTFLQQSKIGLWMHQASSCCTHIKRLSACRHMVLHMVQGFRQAMLGSLIRWMHNKTHPAASMMSSYKAYKVTCSAHPEPFNEVLDEVTISH